MVTWQASKKGSPHSITKRRVPELILVLGSQPAGDMSHKPGGRLPLLSTRPAVIPATRKKATTNFAAWWTEAQWAWTVCVRLLPTASQPQFEPGPSAPESSMLTTWLPSHPDKPLEWHNYTTQRNYEHKSKPACLVLLLPDVGLFLAAMRLAVSPSLALDIRSLNVELRSMPASCAAVPMLATSSDITVTPSCCWCSAHSQTTLPLAKWHLTDISQINLAVLFHTMT